MGRKLRTSERVAISGITAALGVVILIATVFPSLSYAVPMLAGAVMIIPVAELGALASVPIYVATFLVSLINPLVAKDSLLLYLFLFGLYPILQFSFERIKIRPLRILLKLLYFNASGFLSVWLAAKVFGIPAFDEGIGKLFIIGFVVFANLAFLFYDLLLYKLAYLYDTKYSDRFRKLFKIH